VMFHGTYLEGGISVEKNCTMVSAFLGSAGSCNLGRRVCGFDEDSTSLFVCNTRRFRTEFRRKRSSRKAYNLICVLSNSQVDSVSDQKLVNHSNLTSVGVRIGTQSDTEHVARIRCESFYETDSDLKRKQRHEEIKFSANTRLNYPGAITIVAEISDGTELTEVIGSADVSIMSNTGRRVECASKLLQNEIPSVWWSGSSVGNDKKEIQSKRVMYVSSMAVSKEFRRLGVGHKLLNFVQDLAGSELVSAIFLHVEGENEAAVKLYTKCGFVQPPKNEIHWWVPSMALPEHTVLYWPTRSLIENTKKIETVMNVNARRDETRANVKLKRFANVFQEFPFRILKSSF